MRSILRIGVMGGGLAAAAAFLVAIARRHDRERFVYVLHYVVPMILFAAGFISARLAPSRPLEIRGVAVDLLALALATSRMVDMNIPFSGHLLLLTYGILTAHSRTVRVAAGILLVHATIFKLFVWNDPVTWATGATGGALLAVLHRRLAATGRAPGAA